MMNDFIYVGKIVGTHGIKGELKILSDEDLVDIIFAVGRNLYVGNDYKKEQILTHRVHKNYNLVTLKGYEDINLINDFINRLVYVNISEIKLKDNQYLYYQLLGCKIVENNNNYGEVLWIEKGKKTNYLKVKYDKDYLIPIIDEYIKNIDIKNKIIYTKNVENLII